MNLNLAHTNPFTIGSTYTMKETIRRVIMYSRCDPVYFAIRDKMQIIPDGMNTTSSDMYIIRLLFCISNFPIPLNALKLSTY